MNQYQQNCEVCGDYFVPDKRRKKRCAKTHQRACNQCGNEFIITSTTNKDRQYCSRKCTAESQKRKNTCPICGTTFNKISKTCSTVCEKKLAAHTYKAKNKKRACKICGETFIAENSTQKYCHNQHTRDCKKCGKMFQIEATSKKKYCSSKCASIDSINSEDAKNKRKATSLRNYGTETFQNTEEQKQKIVDSNLKKYGVEHPSMLESTKEKRRRTNESRYGVEYTLQSQEIRERINETNLKKYGHINPFSSKIIQEKIHDTILEKYGTEWDNQSEIVKGKRINTNLAKYGVENVMMFEENIIKAQKTFQETMKNGDIKHSRISKINQNTSELISRSCDNVTSVIFEKSFGKYSSDLCVNEKLFIDINPTITHNTVKSFACVINGCDENCQQHKATPRSYHYKRAVAAKEQGISLIQFYDWDNDEEIIKRINAKISSNVIKISAHKLKLKKITQKEANEFLSTSHIQGAAKNQSYCYGLYNDDELIAVATFGKSRFNKAYEYEFIRYAVKDNFIIHGGSSKLFKQFVKDSQANTVVSYVDFNHTTGEAFLGSLGFVELSMTGPALVYYNPKSKKRITNNALLSLGADKLLGTSYGGKVASGLSNAEIMLLEGFLPIYTAGNRVFVWSVFV